MFRQNFLTRAWFVGAVVVTTGCSAGILAGSIIGATGGALVNRVIDRAVVISIRDCAVGLLLWLLDGSDVQHLHVDGFLTGLIAFIFTNSLVRKELPFNIGGINDGFVGIGIAD